jgi:hypothetical protein
MALPSGPVGSRIGPGHCGGGIAKVAGGGETAGIGAFPLTVEPLGGGLSGAAGTALPSALLIALTRQKTGVNHPLIIDDQTKLVFRTFFLSVDFHLHS